MTECSKGIQRFISRCVQLRDSGASEAVLRSEFMSHIRLIFSRPEDDSWIDHYSAGTEAHTKVGQMGGYTASRFIDNLVGSTTIEYESDLRSESKKSEGYRQVREHAAGLIRSGIVPSQIRGVLSDTVDWYVYDVCLEAGAQAESCTMDNVALQDVDSLSLHAIKDTDVFVSFVRKHLAREQSRPLRAALLTYDLGLESGPYKRQVDSLIGLVDGGRAGDPSICLATDLWSQFVDYLEGESYGFRRENYVDEVYLCVLARLLTANVLRGRALVSDEKELRAILDGSYYRDQYRIENMVEQDYFGWLGYSPYIGALLPIAQDIQRDLYAYDFGSVPEEDLFGRLMAQLGRRSQRKLLGQEWTPSWLARLLAERCLDSLPEGETPRIVDMCCGSGSILAEVIRAARGRLHLHDMSVLQGVATGFDVDPLAVSLSKATWLTTLAREVSESSEPIVIPIYHADSLFAVTPLSKSVPSLGGNEAIEVSLDGIIIRVPNALLQPEYGALFEQIVDWAYDESIEAKKRGDSQHLTRRVADEFLKGASSANGVTIPADLVEPLGDAVHRLAQRMADLAIAQRNGIWAFILRNTYRPGLLTGQFNGLVSNPPWLAMSRLADNPYLTMLKGRAQGFGIQPTGSSFLHLELGTTHLLHAVDRYLAPNASIACLVPGTVLNGHQHEPFRRRQFWNAQRPVNLQIRELWQITPGTFKYPGAAIVGYKATNIIPSASGTISGFVARESGLEEVGFSERNIGASRLAWILEEGARPVATQHVGSLPQQGADLMPRTAVSIEILDKRGPEYRVDTPGQGSSWAFTVKAAKELKEDRFPGFVAPPFIHKMAQSENLLPFLLGQHRAPVAIPAIRDDRGEWTILSPIEIGRLGFTRTARRFRRIDERLLQSGKGKPLQERIDERHKLKRQVFGSEGHLVVSGAGGKHICAAYISLETAPDLVIDQTLYWQVIADADEAWYRVGLLNSRALTEAIRPFNPKGAFGERHIHSLPYRLIPPYDATASEHMGIAELARRASREVQQMVMTNESLRDPNRGLRSRRNRVRSQLMSVPVYKQLDNLCSTVLELAPQLQQRPEPSRQLPLS